jgi:hypothetical protein
MTPNSTLTCPALSPMPTPALVFPNLAVWQWLAITVLVVILLWGGVLLCLKHLATRRNRLWGAALWSSVICCFGAGAYAALVVEPLWRTRMEDWYSRELSEINISQVNCLTALDHTYNSVTRPFGNELDLVADFLMVIAPLLLMIAFSMFLHWNRSVRVAV